MVKQTECMFAIWPTCQCIFACQLLYTTSQQASPAQSYFLFYFVVWHTGDKVQSIHQLLGYVHDSSGYKCLRPGSHHQVVSPLSSRVSARCPLVQQLPQYRVVSKSALGSLSLVWRAVGWLGLYQVLCWRTVYHVKILGEQTVWTTNAVPGLGFNECYVWSIEKHYKICCWDFKLAWGLS